MIVDCVDSVDIVHSVRTVYFVDCVPIVDSEDDIYIKLQYIVEIYFTDKPCGCVVKHISCVLVTASS